MKITCESCSAQYDLEDNRIPPSGLTTKCPACLHSFTVRRGAPSAPPPVREVALSDLSEVALNDDETHLPAPVPEENDEPNLPAPVGKTQPRDQYLIDLPAPVAKKPDFPKK